MGGHTLLILAAVAGLRVMTPSRVESSAQPWPTKLVSVNFKQEYHRWRAPLTNSPHPTCQLYLCEYKTLTKHNSTLIILMIKNSSTNTEEYIKLIKISVVYINLV